MIFTLHVDRLRVYGHHGVLPRERIVGAYFYVTLTAEVRCDDIVINSDELAGTVNYADVTSCIQSVMAKPCQLLEYLVWEMGKTLFDEFPRIQRITLRIDKENPPMKAQCDSVGVESTMERE